MKPDPRKEYPLLILFGANINPLHNLTEGLRQLHQTFPLEAISTVWRSDPLPSPEGDAIDNLGGAYLNGAVRTRTTLEPQAVKKILNQIEADRQRLRTSHRYAPRPLDLDIGLMGGRVINEPTLTIPDPDLLTRPFVALPLAQLMPDLIHPLQKKSLATLAQRFLPLDGSMIEDPEATKRLQSLIKQ